LIPFPPASVSAWLARCRCPSWKLGTVSVRSMAALRVTVTITASHPPEEVRERASDVPADAARKPGRRDRARRHERARSDEPAAARGRARPDRRPALGRANEAPRDDDLLHERTPAPDGAEEWAGGAKIAGPAAEAGGRARVGAARADHGRAPVLGEPPGEKRG